MIKYDYVILRAKADELRRSANMLKEQFTNIVKSAQKVSENFEGSAADSYFSSFNNLSSRFNEFVLLVNEMATAVDQTADDMEATETKIAGTV